MRLLTVKELSEIIKAKPKTIYQWAELGQIPCMKINGVLRFDMDEIEKWLQGCKKYPSSGYNYYAKAVASGPKKGGIN